jgi:hypothetical protein
MLPLPPTFDAPTVTLMGRVCDEAWDELQAQPRFLDDKTHDTRALLARRVMAAVSSGERDPNHLRRMALTGIYG